MSNTEIQRLLRKIERRDRMIVELRRELNWWRRHRSKATAVKAADKRARKIANMAENQIRRMAAKADARVAAANALKLPSPIIIEASYQVTDDGG